MTALIRDGDIAYIKSLYPLIDVKIPTPQMEQAIFYYLRGMRINEAARMAGYQSGTGLRLFIESESGRAILEHLRDREFEDVRVTRDTLTAMFFEAFHGAATSAEKVMATRELGKLHGIYPESKPGVTVNVNAGQGSSILINQKKVEGMSDEELLKLAPQLMELLQPPVPIDSTCTRIPLEIEHDDRNA